MEGTIHIHVHQPEVATKARQELTEFRIGPLNVLEHCLLDFEYIGDTQAEAICVHDRRVGIAKACQLYV